VDIEEVFGEDYLYFYETFLTDELSEADAALLWRLLGLEPDIEVLDIGCGHGRIANRLAARGARVTGLDATPLFLECAREDADRRGVEVEYVQGDMRELPWRERFDAAYCWFTTFGYFDEGGNRAVLEQACSALRPGGQLVLELHSLWGLARVFLPWTVTDRESDLLVDRNRFEPLTGRSVHERTIVRDGSVRRTEYAVRLFSFTELRDWLVAAGFASVVGYDRQGGELTADSRRMVVIATR
jgi:SAM-dependent methyltransferase